MKNLLPQITVATEDIRRDTSQLEVARPDTPEAKAVVHKLDIAMRKAADLRDELVETIKDRDDAMKSSSF